MNINATIIGQMITFAVLVIFTMKYVWPPLTKAMQDRQQKIADGLAAAERGRQDLEMAQTRCTELLQDAKNNAAQIIEQAHGRGVRIVEEAKEQARLESGRLVAHAHTEIAQQVNLAKRQLQQQVADLAVVMAEKIVQHDIKIDAATHQKLLDRIAEEI